MKNKKSIKGFLNPLDKSRQNTKTLAKVCLIYTRIAAAGAFASSFFFPSQAASQTAGTPQTYSSRNTLHRNLPQNSLTKAQNSPEKKSFEWHLDVEKYKLKNGMTVLLHADKKAPLVSYQTWYRVGSQDEAPKQTGMAHLFEHMMFRETKRRDGKQFLKNIEAKGIYYNAYTTFDRTVYHFNLPKTELDFIAELEAERMIELAVTEKNLKLEQEIVKEERLMRYENKPQNIWIDLFELVFRKSKYKHPVIGYREDINNVSVEDCIKFYNTFYSPNNAVLVITGPIHIGKTKKIIKKYYDSLEPSVLPERFYPKESKKMQAAERNLYRKVQAESLTLAYLIPKAGSEESYALDILSFVLGGGRASRLYQKLVENKKLSISVSSDSYFLNNEGLFIVTSALHPEKPLSEAEELILEEIKNILENSITEEELARAQTNIVKSHIEELKTAAGKASLLAYHETVFFDYTHLFKELKKYQKVTVQNVLSVARKYLNPYQRSSVRLYPESKKTKRKR